MKSEQPYSIWWLHPAAPFGIAGVVIGISAYVIPEATYRNYWRMPKFFEADALLLTLACCVVFALGALMSAKFLSLAARPKSAPALESIPWDVVAVFFRISFYLCVTGYLIWIGLAVQRGMTIQDAVRVVAGEKGAMYDARFTYLPTVGGVTTLTQFGIAAAIFGAVLGLRRGWKAVRFRLATLLTLALIRALINSERFALIELIVPFLVTVAAFKYLSAARIRPGVRRLINIAPAAGLVALLVFFTAFEYLRSWSNYYAGRDLNLWEFGAMRLLGYYVTSFNNGAYFIHRLEPLQAPYFSLHFLWTFPLSSPFVKRLFPNPLLDTSDKWFYFPFLESEANVEFNNANGVFFPLMDFGAVGGLIYWFAAGLACGALYELYRRREPIGVFVFPLIYLCLMEAPLTLYWGEGRAVFPLALLMGAPVLLWLLRRTGAGVRISRLPVPQET